LAATSQGPAIDAFYICVVAATETTASTP
jgi:hypothetical protein